VLADSHFSQAGMQIMPMWMLVDSQLLICFATRDTRMNYHPMKVSEQQKWWATSQDMKRFGMTRTALQKFET
jgi:hypothetical protein